MLSFMLSYIEFFNKYMIGMIDFETITFNEIRSGDIWGFNLMLSLLS